MKLDIIPISNINIGKRFRKDYGDLDDLALSIKSKGLICPIAVSKIDNEDNEDNEDNTFKLAAGGRRLAAHKLLELQTIPCRIYDHDLSDLELRSIELEENIKRKELGYLEEIKLKDEILNLQQAIHGKKTSKNSDATGVSMRDVADLIGVDQSTLSKDISLNSFVEEFPEVEWDKMNSKSEALKMKNKIEESFIRAEMSKRARETIGDSGSSIFINKLINSYIIKDFFVGVKDIPDNSINFIEIDPPYAIDLKTAKKQYAYEHEKYNEIISDDYPEFLDELFSESYRVMSENSWLICWFAPEPWFDVVYNSIIRAGFKTNRMCGLWIKPTGQTKSPSLNLANQYEMFFYAKKGNPVLAIPGQLNAFHHPAVSPTKKLHPTERPIELLDDILTTFATENSRVLVPFAGSGNTLISTAKNKMIPIGFDLTEEYKNSYILKIQEMFKES